MLYGSKKLKLLNYLDTVSQATGYIGRIKYFHKYAVNNKSNDWIWVLFKGRAPRPYNRIEIHLLFMSCKMIFSKTILPIFSQNAIGCSVKRACCVVKDTFKFAGSR